MRNSAKRSAKLSASTATVETVANVPAIIETATPDTANVETVSSDIVNAGPVLDNATGETIQPETINATEAKPDPAATKAAAIAASRAAIAAVYSVFNAAAVSIPVKPTRAFKLAPSVPHANARKPTERQAAAIALGLVASGSKLAPGATFTRVFENAGTPYAIENGCAADALRSGMLTVSGDSPLSETFTLTKTGHEAIRALLGSKLLSAAGL